MEKRKNKKKGSSKGMPNWVNNLLMGIVLVALVSSFFSLEMSDKSGGEMTISELAVAIEEEQVSSIVVKGEKLDIVLVDGTEKESKKELEASLLESLAVYDISPEDLRMVSIAIKNESGFGYFLERLFPYLFPLILLVFLFWFLSGQVKASGMKALSFGQSRARVINPKDQKVKFSDVAGNKEAKEEISEVVEFLKNPKKFFDLGAKMPKGVLLMGAPGTGKTLLARAVAGEAKVPFFHLSGSEFVEMFVGVGAARTRDLFAMAKKVSPSIIFIDEIDAVGRSRGVGLGGGNDEREQTLNQILVEMDGFEPKEKVIVIAATNRYDVLDKALLRPGRFDRRIVLDMPDRGDRLAILKIHAGNKPMEDDVDLAVIAQRTPGFSGADLESLMNEAAILAARKNVKKIAMRHIVDSIDKVLIGPERKSHLHNEREKKVTAYHEAGHALVASVLPYADPVRKVTIVARGRTGGYTLKLPEEERKLHTKKQFLDDIAMSLGGYVAEQMLFDDVSTGASNDIQVATKIARSMVTLYGMSEVVGPVALDGVGDKVMFGYGVDGKDYSEETGSLIDREVSRIMKEAMEKAKVALLENRKGLDAVALKLVESETLEQEEYEAILKENGVDIVSAWSKEGR